MNSKRNQGLDLLKLLAMLGVMILHILGHGGAVEAVRGGINTLMLMALKVLCIGAVDCFVLVTGFTMRRVHFARVAELWLRTMLYAFIIALFFFLTGQVRIKEVFKGLIPIISNRYWFFSCYTGLCLLIPLLNAIGHQKLILFTASLISLMSVLNNDVMQLHNGYSLGWFIVLYLVGGSVRDCTLRSRWLLAIASGCMVFSLSVAVFIHSTVLIEYMSPTVMVSSVCLVILFSRLKIRSNLLRRVTPLVFSAYLLQDNQLVRELLIKDRFAGHASPLIVVAAGLACLVIGCAVDIPREWLFQKLHVRSRLDWVDRLLQTNGAISGKDDKL